MTPRDRPVRLAGYPARKDPVSTILDPIEISAVLLESSGRRCLIIGFDLMIVGSELQNLILAKLQRMGFSPGEVVLLASHTHYAPATDQACRRLGEPDTEFVNDAAGAAEKLVRRIQQERPSEVSLSVLQGELDHSIHRRRYWPFPTLGRTYGFRLTSVSLAPNPSGPRDETATVVLLRRVDDGRVLGVVWHYTCHPTAVVPATAISSDYPGAVRRALRQRFGEVPCVFAQGFCGDIRPNIPPSPEKSGFADRLRRLVRTVASGPTFREPSAAGWASWSRGLAAAVSRIAQGSPVRTLAPNSLQTGSSSIPLSDFFEGSTPAKRLSAQVVRLGGELEIVALSAEVNVEWKPILETAVPAPSDRLRLYVGYLGALYGYLPTAAQIAEGGYEVEGFQPLFGMAGRFRPDQINPAVVGCVKNAMDDLERTKDRLIEPVPAPAP